MDNAVDNFRVVGEIYFPIAIQFILIRQITTADHMVKKPLFIAITAVADPPLPPEPLPMRQRHPRLGKYHPAFFDAKHPPWTLPGRWVGHSSILALFGSRLLSARHLMFFSSGRHIALMLLSVEQSALFVFLARSTGARFVPADLFA